MVNKKIDCKTTLLYIGYIIIMFFLFTRKINYHIDELLSYNLANAEAGFSVNEAETYSPAGKPFVDAMSSKGKFELNHVWKQQTNDTHPPLYYVLLHGICTLFPNTVSMRYAAVINIIFELFILYIIRKILRLLLSDERMVFITSMAYILCAGVLSITTFLRMYVISIFWVVLATYLFIKYINEYRIRDFVLISLVTIGGALTHYYNLIYLFFISVVVGVLMLYEKRIREMLFLILSMMGAGGCALLIFPGMVRHILDSNGRGMESIENLSKKDLFEQLEIYVDLLNVNIFGNVLLPIVGIIFFTFVLYLFRDEMDEGNTWLTALEKKRYICMLLPTILYIIVVSKSAPYNTDRYISPIYGVVFVGVLSLLIRCLEYYFVNKKPLLFIYGFTISIMISIGLNNCNWPYLNTHTREMLEYAEMQGGSTDAICIYDLCWKILPSYLEISKCRSVTFYEAEDYTAYKDKVKYIETGEQIALFLIGIDQDEFLNAFMEDNPEYKIIKESGGSGYGACIYLKKGQ